MKCERCMYRARPHAGYQCDYYAITGHTRRAVPAARCGRFRGAPPVGGRGGYIAACGADLSKSCLDRKRGEGGRSCPSKRSREQTDDL